MAKACGLSAATVSRIWRAFGLKPHRCETFKLSRDPSMSLLPAAVCSTIRARNTSA